MPCGESGRTRTIISVSINGLRIAPASSLPHRQLRNDRQRVIVYADRIGSLPHRQLRKTSCDSAPSKSIDVHCRIGSSERSIISGQRGLRRSLPHRQLRKSRSKSIMQRPSSLPHRQLRKLENLVSDAHGSSLPHRQLRNLWLVRKRLPSRSLPHRQLRNSTRHKLDLIRRPSSLPHRQLRKLVDIAVSDAHE